MWAAIALTVAAAAGNNIGKALQKHATKTLPRLVLTPDVLRLFVGSPAWLAGMGADLGGAVLMVQAFSMAPLSIVQPVSAVGLAFLMMFSHFFLHERLNAQEWAAAATAVLGIVFLGASSGGGASSGSSGGPAAPPHAMAGGGMPLPPTHVLGPDAPLALQPPPPPLLAAHASGPGPAHILFSFLLCVGALGAEVAWRQRHQRKASKGGAGQGAATGADAAACGLEAGVAFGLSAAACRTGFQLSQTFGWLMVPLGLAGSILLTSGGMVLQTRGFKAGSSIVVCTLAAAASMVAGVVVGLVVLGEQLPSGRTQQALRLVAWALILLGVAGLAGPSGRDAAAAVVLAPLASLPPPWRARLPYWLQQALKAEGVLPLANVHAQ